MRQVNLVIYLVVLLVAFLFMPKVLAESTPPALPTLFYGALQINGQPAAIGTVVAIRLKSNGTQLVSVPAQELGRYFIEVPCQAHIGEVIVIKTDNLVVQENTCVDAMITPSVNVDLSIDMADVVVDDESDAVNIPASLGDVAEAQISFTTLFATLSGQRTATVGSGGLIINRNSSEPTHNFTVVFPANTVITGPSGWDGVMRAPAVSNLSISLPTEEGKINHTEEVVSIGLSGQSLLFDRAVSLLLPRMAGKLVGFSHSGSDFTAIVNECPADNGDSLVGVVEECKFNRGEDLVVWTKHFTNFVIFTQTAVVSSGGGAAGYFAPAIPIATPTSTPTSTPEEILGVKIIEENKATSTVQAIDEGLKIFATSTADILDYKRDLAKERIVLAQYFSKLTVGQKNISEPQTWALINFIAYGTPETVKLGLGERAGVLNSYSRVFNKWPGTATDWRDVEKIANGAWPQERNLKQETVASLVYQKIYWRRVDWKKSTDQAAVMLITYGLRPAQRNLASEKAAVKTFVTIFKYSPQSAEDWNIVRAIAYSGAKR